MNKPIPVIDLFAGPGGLGEGFYEAGFDIRLSIECDAYAHSTLAFRAFNRLIRGSQRGREALRRFFLGELDESQLRDMFSGESRKSNTEAWMAKLGETSDAEVDQRIREALGGANNWVLIGGPPCQAYSLVGRARMRGTKVDFEDDHRHFLYKQYLRIVEEHQPAAFVMENVKGILSASVKKIDIFQQILSDLANPSRSLGKRTCSPAEYDLYPVTESDDALIGAFRPEDFLVKAEEYGVPQRRHRVFVVGIRRGSGLKMGFLKQSTHQSSLGDVLDGLPRLRSGLTRRSYGDAWEAVAKIQHEQWLRDLRVEDPRLAQRISSELSHLLKEPRRGSLCLETGKTPIKGHLSSWYQKHHLGFTLNHECRDHMAGDLQRYFFAACYAKVYKKSPKLGSFPKELLPAHQNVHLNGDKVIFDDRFRVQCAHEPSTTIVSHISKDGHYYIHPDPSQCRSLTVREAARLQTFPDDYFFTGPRTAQFHQVGNAVPPYLAYQIGQAIKNLIGHKPI